MLVEQGDKIEKTIRLKLLEEDNIRLRRALSLKEFNNDKRISAAVISLSLIHISEPRDATLSRMPSSA